MNNMLDDVIEIKDHRLNPLDIIILILSIYVLGVVVIDTLWVLPAEISRLLSYIDNIICVVFFYDFVTNFRKAKNKLKFMRLGWIDLLSCIPMVDYLRAGRMLRLIRLIRVVRAFKTTNHLVNHIFANKSKGALTSVFVVAMLFVLFSAIAILEVENDPNSNIKTAEDAIWWAYVTVTTVGYGDKFPVTTEGRVIAAALMTVGVGLFGTFTAYISSLFVTNSKNP